MLCERWSKLEKLSASVNNNLVLQNVDQKAKLTSSLYWASWGFIKKDFP